MKISKSASNMESYTDPEFESHFKTLESDLSVFNVQAKQDGLDNKPTTLQQYWIRVITLILTMIQKSIDFNYSKNQMYSDLAVVQGIRATASEKISTLQKDKNEKEKGLVPIENERKNLKAQCIFGLSRVLRIIIPLLFGICEGGMTFNMLMTSSLPLIISILIASLVSLVSCFGVHLGANYICKAITVQQRKTRYAIVTAIAFIVACALGIWRASAYQESANINSQIDLHQQTATTVQISPWSFIILSFIAFVVALGFEVKYWISEEQKAKIKEYEEKDKEFRNQLQVIESLSREIESTREKLNADCASIMRKQEYASANEQRLISLAYEVISRYESINLDFRRDSQYPAFFGDKINLDFKLYFTQLFNSLNNQQ